MTLWTLAKSELEYSDIMQLKLTAKTASDEGDDDASLCGLAGGAPAYYVHPNPTPTPQYQPQP